MTLKNVLLLGFAVAFIIIGIDQTIVLGFQDAYWAFMIALVLFFVYNLQKRPKSDASPTADRRSSAPKKHRKKP